MLRMKDRQKLKMEKAFVKAKLDLIEEQFTAYNEFIDDAHWYYSGVYKMSNGEDYDLAMTKVYREADEIFQYDNLLEEWEEYSEKYKDITRQLKCKLLKNMEVR